MEFCLQRGKKQDYQLAVRVMEEETNKGKTNGACEV